MPGLNVVCLISGGKDSLFSILHCQHNGHRVVALANLHPPLLGDDTAEDVDSYMYQTIGHAVIPLFEQALGLPLYRQEITGTAVNVDKSYAQLQGGEDETESLIPLLKRVIASHPEVNAISTGAILSDYQRTRVESVALRLGLTPLSYLWQWPQIEADSPTSLLEAMASAGQDSRIIKVASGGLDESFLWQNVADWRTQARLTNVARRFGTLHDGAVLGEGGEYETLAVAGPSPLWKGKIVVGDCDRLTSAGEAGVFSTKIIKARVEPLDGEVEAEATNEIFIPPLLDHSFARILSWINSPDFTPQDDSNQDNESPTSLKSSEHDKSALLAHSDWQLLISNITGDGTSAAEQMQSLMEKLQRQLDSHGHSMDDIAYISIILADMAEFPSINAVYTKHFDRPNPPARVTIACADVLAPGAQLMVSCTSLKSSITNSRTGLHVQSRSYWAPANIGPYSQAIAVSSDSATDDRDRIVYIAGQIPLVPASMILPTAQDLPKGGTNSGSGSSRLKAGPSLSDDALLLFKLQVVLSLQHVSRVGQAMGVKTWGPGIAFIVATADADIKTIVQLVQAAWAEFYAEGGDQSEVDSVSGSETFDVWDVKHGLSSHGSSHFVTNESTPRVMARSVPPLKVITVDALPRGSEVEWVTCGRSGEVARVPPTTHYMHLLRVFKDHRVH